MRKNFIFKSLTFIFYIAFLFSKINKILALNYINNLHNEDKELILKKVAVKKYSLKKGFSKKGLNKNFH